MGKLNHLNLPEYPSFVTTRTAGSEEVFAHPEQAEILIETLLFGKDQDWYDLLSFVVMPDHLHLVIVPKSRSLSEIMKSIKGYSARKINESLDRNGPIWESGYFDYLLDGREKLLARIRYIHENPVREGLADEPQDYPYCSIKHEEELDRNEYLK